MPKSAGHKSPLSSAPDCGHDQGKPFSRRSRTNGSLVCVQGVPASKSSEWTMGGGETEAQCGNGSPMHSLGEPTAGVRAHMYTYTTYMENSCPSCIFSLAMQTEGFKSYMSAGPAIILFHTYPALTAS